MNLDIRISESNSKKGKEREVSDQKFSKPRRNIEQPTEDNKFQKKLPRHHRKPDKQARGSSLFVNLEVFSVEVCW